MMTWLTRISWFDTAADMSDNLLLQQREEASKLLQDLFADGGITDELAAHPIYRMWRDHDIAVAVYASVMNAEAVRRGYHGRSAVQIDNVVGMARRYDDLPYSEPPWKSDTDVLRSHRSNLMRRFPGEYAWHGTPERMPYVWPFIDDDGGYGLFVSKYDRELLATGERSLPKDIKSRIENL